jgi:16S rRNA (cytosine967-C5)-methyltransferase
MTPEAVAALVQTQAALLAACAQAVKPGGVLVYSTCTLLPEENEGQVAAFLAAHSEYHLDGPDTRLLAHRDGMEGFYIARMVRAGGRRA